MGPGLCHSERQISADCRHRLKVAEQGHLGGRTRVGGWVRRGSGRAGAGGTCVGARVEDWPTRVSEGETGRCEGGRTQGDDEASEADATRSDLRAGEMRCGAYPSARERGGSAGSSDAR